MKAKKKVLILDDEPIVCERLHPALEKLGFYVATYTESQKAVNRLAEEEFDVLVTDLKMKKPDGLDVMNFAKQKWPSTKVIIITGFATVETAKESIKGGAVDFVAKPFKIRELCDLVVRISRGSED